VSRLIVVALLAACGAPSPKTYAQAMQDRLAHPACARTCPLGQHLDPVEPVADRVLADCCNDPIGLTWSSCAWNSAGRYASFADLTAETRISSVGCGAGLPACERPR